MARPFWLPLSLMPGTDRPFPEILAAISQLSQDVIDQVVRLRQGQGDRRLVEQAVLSGLEESTEGRDQLSQMLEMGRIPRHEAEAVADALAQIEQKLVFFQGCTMRRSSLPPRGDDEEAELYAAQSEQLAGEARDGPGLDWLIEAYKRTEALEARILELRESSKSGTGPEPRVLDLPRARVLVSRRTIGAAVVELDDLDDEIE
jgi:hypothetical protein